MIETVPLRMGRQSTGEEYLVDLASLPNLFISHSHDMQLPDLFLSFIDQLMSGEANVLFCMSLSSRIAELIKPSLPEEKLFKAFLHQDGDEGQLKSIDEFIQAIMQEMKSRKAFYKKASNKLRLASMLVFIDDIFEVIMSPQKKTVLNFIELLMTGATVDIFFILGSSGLYRNLLDQIINVNPSLKKKLAKSLQGQPVSQPLGAEMVINPDGLVFYRERGEKIYMRLYP